MADEFVNLGVANVVNREYAEQSSDRQSLACCGDHFAQSAVKLRIDLVHDFVRFDQAKRVAVGEGIAFGYVPFGDRPLGHLNAPFGHGECAYPLHRDP